MIDFGVKCPKNYPLKCNLLDSEKEALIRSEKYKGFLMYQFEDRKGHFKMPYYCFSDLRKSFNSLKSDEII
ncbi:MAG: hypothetical protein ABIL44_07870 [candidate division WOR-3 bacterium]